MPNKEITVITDRTMNFHEAKEWAQATMTDAEISAAMLCIHKEAKITMLKEQLERAEDRLQELCRLHTTVIPYAVVRANIATQQAEKLWNGEVGEDNA